MKLSKIINTKNLTSVTIKALDKNTIVCEIFTSDRPGKRAIKKLYKKLDVDIKIPLVSNDTIKHLGIKKYYHLVEKNFYINLYYY
tara:strand:- start:185 stop:439 length:255 start_codon:yes stop_codon:yes gene_type:complete